MKEFLVSMPEAYGQVFAPAESAEHAAVVARRGGRVAHAELCRAGGRELVCLVADDRPGLLSLITDALLTHGWSIVSAHAFCRTRADGVVEGLDFLELGPSRASDAEFRLDPAEVDAFAQTLVELILEDIRASSRLSASPIRPRTRVYFELGALQRGQHTLYVETPDSDGVLHAITSALYAQGARIIGCQIGTEGGMARDRFELSSENGEPWSGAELCDIQFAVLEALPRR